MDRITDKNTSFAEKETMKIFQEEREHWQDFCIRIGRMENKLKELENLEDEIGCSLDVRCKVTYDSYIYDKDGSEYTEIVIFKDYILAYNGREDRNGFLEPTEFNWKDYQKTWWLKNGK